MIALGSPGKPDTPCRLDRRRAAAELTPAATTTAPRSTETSTTASATSTHDQAAMDSEDATGKGAYKPNLYDRVHNNLDRDDDHIACRSRRVRAKHPRVSRVRTAEAACVDPLASCSVRN